MKPGQTVKDLWREYREVRQQLECWGWDESTGDRMETLFIQAMGLEDRPDDEFLDRLLGE